jgi:hypothetical protein
MMRGVEQESEGLENRQSRSYDEKKRVCKSKPYTAWWHCFDKACKVQVLLPPTVQEYKLVPCVSSLQSTKSKFLMSRGPQRLRLCCLKLLMPFPLHATRVLVTSPLRAAT